LSARAADASPWVVTDQEDYAPGQTVTITGGDWLPGEAITLVIHEAPPTHPDTTYQVVADANGGFVNAQFLVLDDHIGTAFTLTATGASGGQATTTFTDSASGDCFRTVASGNWNATGTWESAPTSGSCTVWTAATLTPTSTASTITIQAAHTVHVTAGVTADQLTVNGDLEIDSGVILTINHAATPDVTINGTVGVTGTLTQVTSSTGSYVEVTSGGTLTVKSGGLINGSGGSGATRSKLTVDSGGQWTIDSGGSLSAGGSTGMQLTVMSGATATLNGSVTAGTTGVPTTFDGTVNASANITISSISDLEIGGTVTMTAGILAVSRGNGGSMGSINSGGSLILQGTSTFSLGGAAGRTVTIAGNGTLDIGPTAVVSGSQLVTSAGSNVKIGSTTGVNGNITAASVFGVGTNWTFKGSAAQITGSSLPATVNDLTINDSGGDVTLTASVTVNGTLTLTTGDLVTGASNTVTQPSTATSAGTTDVVGTVIRSGFVSGGGALTFGNPNTTVKIDSGTAPTPISVKLVKSAPTSPAFSTAVTRTYTITPTGGSSVSATVQLHYRDGDLNGDTDSALHLWRNVSGTWTDQDLTGASTTRNTTSSDSDATNNWVKLTGITSFSAGTSADWALSSSAIDHFVVSAPGSATAGTAFSVTVTAQDQFNNAVTSHTGTIHFTSTDANAVLPGDYTFTGGDAGVHVFTSALTLKTAGSRTVTVTGSSKTGTSGTITVNAGAFTKLQLLVPGEVADPGSATGKTAASPTAQTAGTAFNVTVNAVDANWNLVSSVTDTVAITSSDTNATLPSNTALVAGTKTFSVTLKTAGSKTVTATDSSDGAKTANTSPSITVNAGALDHFAVSAPGSATAGSAFSVTVTAQDQFNNTVTSYTGTIHFTSSDGAAALPADYPFVGGDAGVHTFTSAVTLNTAGNQTVTVTGSGKTGTSGTIVVTSTATSVTAVTFGVLSSSASASAVRPGARASRRSPALATTVWSPAVKSSVPETRSPRPLPSLRANPRRSTALMTSALDHDTVVRRARVPGRPEPRQRGSVPTSGEASRAVRLDGRDRSTAFRADRLPGGGSDPNLGFGWDKAALLQVTRRTVSRPVVFDVSLVESDNVSVTRLAASDNAFRALLLLMQRVEGLRVSEVVEELEISYTGARKSLDMLLAEDLSVATGPRHSFAPSPRADAAVRFALAFLPVDVALAALARGNVAIEYAGIDQDEVLVVFRRFSDPADESRARRAIDDLLSLHPEVRVEFARKEDLREQLLEDLAPRRRASDMRVLAGSIDRTFPDRTRHGDSEARTLGHLNKAIKAPSGRRLRALARQYGLRRILAFGSATRADFRPDSDIDVLVDPMPGRRLGLAERVGLMADAEQLFGRDVDLVTAPVGRKSLADRIGRDGVVLYDAAR
jgi:predicted nucleotidyltransferase